MPPEESSDETILPTLDGDGDDVGSKGIQPTSNFPHDKKHGEQNAASAYWQVGNVIADLYDIQALVGMGGNGTVHRVRHLEWGIDLAVKTPTQRALQLAGGRERFQEEAYEWIQLGIHPNIVNCFYVRTLKDEIPRIFMEYVDAGSLADWLADGRLLKKGKHQAETAALDVGIQICWGLGWAHQCGIIHRDIKPANIMMTRDGLPKVTDFGLVKLVAHNNGSQSRNVATTTLKAGTQGYAAPEQVTSLGAITTAADVFALGVVFYDLFHRALDLPDFRNALPAAKPSLYQAELKKQPGIIADVILRCLERDPEARFPNAYAVGWALENAFQDVLEQPYPKIKPEEIKIRADGLNNKALSMLDLGEPSQAESAWEEGLKIDPYHYETIYNLCLWRWRSGQETDDLVAVNRLAAAAQALPNQWQPYYLLGQVHLERGDGEAASQAFNRAIQLAPDEVRDIHLAAERAKKLDKSRCLWRSSGGHDDQISDFVLAQDGNTAVSISSKHKCCWDLKARGYVPLHGPIEVFSKDETDKRKAAIDKAVRFYESHLSPADAALFELDRTLRDKELQSTKNRHGLVLPSNYLSSSSTSNQEITEHTYRAAAISSDSQLLLVACLEGCVDLWDLKHYEYLKSIYTQINTPKGVCFTPDNTHCICYNSSKVNCTDLKTGRTVKIIDYEAGFDSHIAILPDGKCILAGGNQGALNLWGVYTGKLLQTFTDHRPFTITALAITRDGRIAITACEDLSLRVWDLEKGVLVTSVKELAYPAASLFILPDGKGVLSQQGSVLCLWDMESSTCQYTLTGHTQPITSVSLTSDGLRAISSSRDGTLRVWDLSKGRCLRTYQGSNLPPDLVKVTPDNRFAICVENPDMNYKVDRMLYVWGLEGLGESKGDWAISKPRNTSQILQTFSAAQKKIESLKKLIEANRYADAGKLLVEIRTLPEYEMDEKLLDLWHQAGMAAGKRIGLISSHQIHSIPTPLIDRRASEVLAVAVTPDGKRAVSATSGGMLYLWGLQTGDMLRNYNASEYPIRRIAMSTDGQRVISVSRDKKICVWDLESDKCEKIIETMEELGVVALIPDGRQALVGSGIHNSLSLWDLEDRRCLQRFEGSIENINDAKIAADGITAASCDLVGLYLWDISRNKSQEATWYDFNNTHYLLDINGADHPEATWYDIGNTHAIAFTPDSKKVVAAGDDSFLRIINLKNDKILKLPGHSKPILSVTVTSDGRFAVTGSEDNTIGFWDLIEEKCLHRFSWHLGTVTSLSLSKDDRILLSGSADRTTKAFRIDWDYQF